MGGETGELEFVIDENEQPSCSSHPSAGAAASSSYDSTELMSLLKQLSDDVRILNKMIKES